MAPPPRPGEHFSPAPRSTPPSAAGPQPPTVTDCSLSWPHPLGRRSPGPSPSAAPSPRPFAWPACGPASLLKHEPPPLLIPVTSTRRSPKGFDAVVTPTSGHRSWPLLHLNRDLLVLDCARSTPKPVAPPPNCLPTLPEGSRSGGPAAFTGHRLPPSPRLLDPPLPSPRPRPRAFARLGSCGSPRGRWLVLPGARFRLLPRAAPSLTGRGRGPGRSSSEGGGGVLGGEAWSDRGPARRAGAGSRWAWVGALRPGCKRRGRRRERDRTRGGVAARGFAVAVRPARGARS